MKFNKNLIISIFFIFFVSGCNSVKETLSGGKKKNTDEFLVKQKDPLIIPPNFNDLPKPHSQNNKEDDKIENIDLSEVLGNTSLKKKKTKAEDRSLEKSISKILNNK
tara:strand:- start:263 stop:583 length:321 start_codon:yes stop_codon:yes gene_type:complete